VSRLDDHPRPGLKSITVDGIAIAVDVVRNGTAPGPVFTWLHGLGSSSIEAFGEAARHPSLTGTTSLLIDLPGHGLSGDPVEWTYTVEDYATIVVRTLASLVGNPISLVGHSMGGTIAIACAGEAQESVERLILAEPSLDPGSGNLSAHIAAQSEERFVRRGYPALLRLTERQAGHGSISAQSYLPSLRRASPVALHRSATSLCQVRRPSFREQLTSLALPKALIMGDHSPSFKPPLDIPSLKGYVVRDAGHILMADNPEGFAIRLAAALLTSTRE